MNEAGEVFSDAGSRSSSIVSAIEQAAMRQEALAPGSLYVTVGPPLGDPLAAALGLSIVPEASDAYQAWWRSGGITMGHARFRDPSAVTSRVDWLTTRSLDEAVAVIEAAGRLAPEGGVSLGPLGGVASIRLAPEEAAQIPAIESWGSAPGARRYAMRTPWEDRTGVVWVLGEPGARRIEEYSISVESGRLLEWASYTRDGVTVRNLR